MKEASRSQLISAPRAILAQRIREIREGSRLTQAQLAEKLGVSSASVVNRWEKGLTRPSPLAFRKLKELGRID